MNFSALCGASGANETNVAILENEKICNVCVFSATSRGAVNCFLPSQSQSPIYAISSVIMR